MDTTAAPDLFDAENRALQAARAAYDACATTQPAPCRQALGELLTTYERLLRETRRLVRRSDRAELEMNQLNLRLQDLAAELEYRATHDPLTDVLNRAAVIELVNRHFACHDLALIVLDIDHFKRINDSFGHPTGDRVIQGVVTCLKQAVSATAQIGRVGGEEFTVVLPGQGGDGCGQVAHTLRRAIEAYAFDLPDGSGVTASFGVSWLPCGSSFDEAYGLADEALYVAKRGGRNQVALAAGHVHVQPA
ncbi:MULTISPECIES: GGDEF domain-containing protein [unclassified Variovorax]|jgi:diguanylate cyclase (GGDEF)-like protein|uniref:GGDEF domain-containing protein n=1 Tax=unclassified Variovorax TaxID=663243 RepID=UPI0008B68A57|nr:MULTISPECIES: GGDEF domain-containing protein [unclassified Variovorax]SEK10375.1 diguanylate cyclase [Variovorax sp. OK202]SFD67767.1 diguanylate cyclase [Variovorax sp. OK212]